jgi:hypothetical protein
MIHNVLCHKKRIIIIILIIKKINAGFKNN